MNKLLMISLLALIPTVGMAQKAGKKQSLHDQFSGQGYGMAGCGLGSIVFGNKPGMIQVVAATLNGTGYQTFAISSGTSNCSEPGVFARTTEYINTNKVALENDIVRGEGETLASLSEVMECQSSAFAPSMKKNYVASFPNGGATSDQLSAIAFKSCAN